MHIPLRARRFALALFLCLLAGVAFARSGLDLEATTSGFFLSPTLQSVKVAGVVPGSDAERAGFRKGDEILQINDTSIVGRKARAMKAYWDALPAGTAARFVVRRDGRKLTLDMMMGD